MAITLTVLDTQGADYVGAAEQTVIVNGTLNLGTGYTTGGMAVTHTMMNTALATAGFKATVSTIDTMIFGSSAGTGANKIDMRYMGSSSTKVLAHVWSAAQATAGVANTPFSRAKTTETALSPTSHVFTPAGSPTEIISAAGTGGLTAALNLQRNLAPVASADANVASDESTFTTLAGDSVSSAQVTYWTDTAGVANTPFELTAVAEVANATDLSNANFTCFFIAHCEK